jgi:hypothetical protein
MQVINRSIDQLHLSSTVYISTFNGEPKPKHQINISEPLWGKKEWGSYIWYIGRPNPTKRNKNKRN